jgi:hypothetical protein
LHRSLAEIDALRQEIWEVFDNSSAPESVWSGDDADTEAYENELMLRGRHWSTLDDRTVLRLHYAHLPPEAFLHYMPAVLVRALHKVDRFEMWFQLAMVTPELYTSPTYFTRRFSHFDERQLRAIAGFVRLGQSLGCQDATYSWHLVWRFIWDGDDLFEER